MGRKNKEVCFNSIALGRNMLLKFYSMYYTCNPILFQLTQKRQAVK